MATQSDKMAEMKSWKNHPAIEKCVLTLCLVLGAVVLKIHLIYAVILSAILNIAFRGLTLDVVVKTLPRDTWAVFRLIKLKYGMWRFTSSRSTVSSRFGTVARRHPQKHAFLYEDQLWTFRDVECYSNQVAHYFSAIGEFAIGETIALYLTSRPEYVALWLGLSKIGCISSLLNSQLRSDPLVHSLNCCHAKAIIIGEELVDVAAELRSRLPSLQVFVLGQRGRPFRGALPAGTISLDAVLPEMPVEPPKRKVSMTKKDDRLFYIFTSGTTGLPKAAIITNARFFYMAFGISSLLDVLPKDIIYCPLPLYHTAGGILGVGQVLLNGSTVALRNKFSASQFWLDCAKHRCTVAQYIGEICRYLLVQKPTPADRNHSVRMMYGNGLKAEIWKQFQDRFGVAQMGEFYGATEGNASLINTHNKIGAVGFVSMLCPRAYPVKLIRVDPVSNDVLRDKHGMAIQCKPGEAGELVGKISASGIHKFDGYCNGDATKKKIAHDVISKGDSFFLTGDILVMDEYGFMYFKDRTGDTFRWRGENVSTSEVEAAVSRSVGLEAVIVFGVTIPGCEGRAGMACVTGDSRKVDLQRLNSDLKRSLPAYARPIFLRFISKVDETGTFKLIKHRLQTQGFNPRAAHPDKLFYLDPKIGEYQPLDEDVFANISSRAIPF
ncbi:hypothetical protein RvY_05321 [Ramazzottius varieornatus]|uniref:Very long-chain fatty acid transport protein n=1 Tax=Ramazzottius varieornatus TaxID=947166 RepID=A0A1D1V4G2_RAMVA|nr:hypothetical protein RvY_05321 [Ramazzottius varieornatus]